ncbi:molybdenum cofactor guanylyltransferase MobA [Neisseria sp. Ec49-e6-T10]|uniref:molybdenum cofactor guanylyltransferase MobA n=1 Tax=Neisseria sp. Ec49-e6-T10 TaxID=3140744 RepID=UPI003EBE7F98
MNKDTIGTLILSGGLGSRMNYQNKGLTLLQGEPLIAHVLAKVKPYSTYIAISANQDINQYQQFGFPIFSDDLTWAKQGPLAGIQSSIKHFPDELKTIVVVPCDTPFLPENLIPKLHQALYTQDETCFAYAKTEQMIHPSIFLFKKSVYNSLYDHLCSGQRSLKSWLHSKPYTAVFFENEAEFMNINHNKTLAQLNNE